MHFKNLHFDFIERYHDDYDKYHLFHLNYETSFVFNLQIFTLFVCSLYFKKPCRYMKVKILKTESFLGKESIFEYWECKLNYLCTRFFLF